jgi:hypothetical protein
VTRLGNDPAVRRDAGQLRTAIVGSVGLGRATIVVQRMPETGAPDLAEPFHPSAPAT